MGRVAFSSISLLQILHRHGEGVIVKTKKIAEKSAIFQNQSNVFTRVSRTSKTLSRFSGESFSTESDILDALDL